MSLKVSQVDEFVERGFVHLRGAFPRSVADACRDLLWDATGCSRDDPGDIGWHMDASFPPPDRPESADYSEWRVNVRSDGRALLLLFLFSDVGEDDAPTLIRVGSHLLVPRRLEAFGRGGTVTLWDPPGEDLAVARAMGEAGDVYLCHPFLVHSAQRVRSQRPRFLAQPSLPPVGPFAFDGASAVERAIKRGLNASSG